MCVFMNVGSKLFEASHFLCVKVTKQIFGVTANEELTLFSSFVLWRVIFLIYSNLKITCTYCTQYIVLF